MARRASAGVSSSSSSGWSDTRRMWLARITRRRSTPVSLGPAELIAAYAAGLTIQDLATIYDIDVRSFAAHSLIAAAAN